MKVKELLIACSRGSIKTIDVLYIDTQKRSLAREVNIDVKPDFMTDLEDIDCLKKEILLITMYKPYGLVVTVKAD